MATCGRLLAPRGRLLVDSSDIAYLYQGRDLPVEPYYGEQQFSFEYQGKKDTPFDWLYLDATRLGRELQRMGLDMEIVYDDGEEQYLALIQGFWRA